MRQKWQKSRQSIRKTGVDSIFLIYRRNRNNRIIIRRRCPYIELSLVLKQLLLTEQIQQHPFPPHFLPEAQNAAQLQGDTVPPAGSLAVLAPIHFCTHFRGELLCLGHVNGEFQSSFQDRLQAPQLLQKRVFFCKFSGAWSLSHGIGNHAPHPVCVCMCRLYIHTCTHYAHMCICMHVHICIACVNLCVHGVCMCACMCAFILASVHLCVCVCVFIP